MKRLSRLSISTAAICMALGGLPACTTPSATDMATRPAGDMAARPASVAPATVSPAPPAQIPIVAKQLDLTLHMHYRDRFVWDEDWPVAKELTRLTNIKLVSTANKAVTNSVEANDMLMASGKLPDIVGGNSLKDYFISFGMEGAFVPLNKLIDQHAPNIKAYLQNNPLVAQAIKAPDGNIYHIPYVPDGTVSRGWWIRQDWLDKLNLKTPQNVDELYTVLKAFRDQDPNGNGKKDEVPYFNGSPQEVYRLALLWGARSSGSNTYLGFMAENGKLVHPFAEERFKVAMKNIAKWYAEGLIDKEIFTRKSRAREVLFSANQGGVTHDWFASTSSYNQASSIPSRVPGFKVVAMPPPADVNGKRLEEDSRKLVMPDGWAISTSNKHPVETIKLFNFYFTDVGARLSNFGVEGQHYTLVDGKPIFKDSVLKSATPVNSQMWDIGAQIPIGFPQDYFYEEQWTFPEGVKGREMYIKGQYIIPQFPGVNMTKAERTVYDRYWPDLEIYMMEMAQSWVLGTKDVDATWGEYQAYLKENGLDQVIGVMQQAYDRQYK